MTKNVNKNCSTWVEIDKSALFHNLKQFIRLAGEKAKICPIIKSNAYGHDMTQAAKTLQNQPIWGFGVVNLEEALLLRQQGVKKPILVLSYANADLAAAIKADIAFSVYSLSFAQKLNQLASRLRKKVSIHVKVDVGTSRLGILPNHLFYFLDELKKLNHIKIKGLFSHLADSENQDWKFTYQQLHDFEKIIEVIEKAGFKIPLKHLSCSAAALGSSETHFDLIRLGISLYGLWPSESARRRARKNYPWLFLKPSLTWSAKIIQIKNLPKNTLIGYGGTYKTTKPIKLAVLPVGYWEGYDRRLSNKGEVLIKGRRCPILGRVCMNMMMVDVSRLKNLKVGERAVLIGQSENKNITADELAAKIDTINYEVVTRINPLIPRIYV